MRFVVTGAAGLTGGAIVEGLASLGHEVVAVVRQTTQWPVRAAVVTVVADCSDVQAMDACLGESDGLLHVAGIHLGKSLADVRSLRELARVVIVSTAGIYSAHR